jgi:hypothetical protein
VQITRNSLDTAARLEDWLTGSVYVGHPVSLPTNIDAVTLLCLSLLAASCLACRSLSCSAAAVSGSAA